MAIELNSKRRCRPVMLHPRYLSTQSIDFVTRPVYRLQRKDPPVSRTSPQEPILITLYRQYLEDEHSASFISAVAERYTLPTLERLAERGERVVRRAAMLALGFLANYESNAVLGRALHDTDRGVRLLAENGIREIWERAAGAQRRGQLSSIMRLITSERYLDAMQSATDLIQQAPWFAEAWNQRAIAHFQLGNYEASVSDCHQTLELNPYHFPAALGLAHCYLELNDGVAALESFRRALRLNPDMEAVRAQVEFLARSLDDH